MSIPREHGRYSKWRQMKVKISSINAGVSGEYFVAAELSKRGFIASITLRNTKGIDILATNPETEKTLNVQVKTHQGKSRSWILNKKAENNYASNLFYVFVSLKGLMDRPDYYIAPSKTVATYVKNSHAEWLRTLEKNGQQRNDSSMRKFEDKSGEYLERWDLLK
jgi:hypothetical protein